MNGLPHQYRSNISWPMVVWFAALGSIPLGGDMLSDPDSYWHVAAGRWILERGSTPASDPFSYSMPGTPWTAHEWLSEVLMASIHDAAGWNGLVILTAFCFAATLTIVARFLNRHMAPVHMLILVALGAGMLKEHLLARPHILALPLLALWLTGLLAAREGNRAPSWPLLGIMMLWANLHGSFTLGLGLLAALGLEAIIEAPAAQRRQCLLKWTAFGVASGLAAMLTPFHWEGLTFTAHILSLEVMLANIGEWRSPNFQHFKMFEVWLLALLAIGLSGRLKLSPIRLLLVVLLTHISLKHGRYMATTGIVAPLLIASCFGKQWYIAPKIGDDAAYLDRLFDKLRPPARTGATLVAATLSLFIAMSTLQHASFSPDKHISPEEGVASIRQANIQGRIFNAYNFGGFLIYAGLPVFIDGRADMYGDKHLEKYLNAITPRSEQALMDLLDEFAIEVCILQADAPAAVLLDHLAGWRLLHRDEISAVHVRRSTGGAS